MIIPPPDDAVLLPPLETSDCIDADVGLRLVPLDSLTVNGVELMASATACIKAEEMGGRKTTMATKFACPSLCSATTGLDEDVLASRETTTDTALLTKAWSPSLKSSRLPANVMTSWVGPLRVGDCVTGANVLGASEPVGDCVMVGQ